MQVRPSNYPATQGHADTHCDLGKGIPESDDSKNGFSENRTQNHKKGGAAYRA